MQYKHAEIKTFRPRNPIVLITSQENAIEIRYGRNEVSVI